MFAYCDTCAKNVECVACAQVQKGDRAMTTPSKKCILLCCLGYNHFTTETTPTLRTVLAGVREVSVSLGFVSKSYLRLEFNMITRMGLGSEQQVFFGTNNTEFCMRGGQALSCVHDSNPDNSIRSGYFKVLISA